MTITVVVVDDQAMVRAGFAALLDAAPDISVVGQAADGVEALAVVRASAPDVVLMDIRMPVMDGITATRELLASPDTSGSRVIVLTTFDLDEYVYDALQAGASGFLLKHLPPSELAAAVRTVAGGDALLAPAVTARLIKNFLHSRPNTLQSPSRAGLTARETEVLALLARGLSNTEIATELVVVEQTIKTHVSHILTKTTARDRAQAVIYAYEHGIVSSNPAPAPEPGPDSRTSCPT